MALARKLIEYFIKSNQAMEMLLDFQRTANLTQYKNLSHPLKAIQDVITRWWSTWRALRRLRFLRAAICALVASNQVDCENLCDYQWEVLHQIEMALEPLAIAQRVFEGGGYVTGSLLCYGLFTIRQSYQSVIDNQNTLPVVTSLTVTLLEDFEARYNFEGGMLVYPSSNVTTSRMNRYNTVHQYSFVAALLDPRMKGNLKTIMSAEHYEQLLEDVLDIMVTQEERVVAERLAAEESEEDDSDDELFDVPVERRYKGNPFNERKMPACFFDHFNTGLSQHETDTGEVGCICS